MFKRSNFHVMGPAPFWQDLGAGAQVPFRELLDNLKSVPPRPRPAKQVDDFSFSILKLIELILSQHNANFKTPSNNTADTYWKHILMVLFVFGIIGTKDD